MTNKNRLYCESLFQYSRRPTVDVKVGDIYIGGNHPVRIQTMVTTPTLDVEATVDECVKLAGAGAELVRITAQGVREAEALGVIHEMLRRKGCTVPLVADIHFNPEAAEVAAKYVEKVRINPGNFTDRQAMLQTAGKTEYDWEADLKKLRARFVTLLNVCKRHGTALRIGSNHGSLSGRIMSKYGDTPEGMVESAMEFLRICKEENFTNVVVSMKASNTAVMVRACRLLVVAMDAEDMHFPLHLGVTEAGDGEDGRIKSAVGIGALLIDGIGDTIRVSLTEAPENEIRVAKMLRDYFNVEDKHQPVGYIDIKDFDPYEYKRYKSRCVHGIGGDSPVAVIADLSYLNVCTRYDRDVENLGFKITRREERDMAGRRFSEDIFAKVRLHVQKIDPCSEPVPDVFFTVSEVLCNGELNVISEETGSFGWFTYAYRDKGFYCSIGTEEILRRKDMIVALDTFQDDFNQGSSVAEARACCMHLRNKGVTNPVIIGTGYFEEDFEKLQIMASCFFGPLLLDGFGDGIMLTAYADISPKLISDLCFGILQATGVRVTKTEYIACPGCGRTLFDLQDTLRKVKEATSEFKNLKIAVMGCIVNGPGEMADADYGYVGAGPGKITLYKGKTPVKKNIPQENAIEELIKLISGGL